MTPHTPTPPHDRGFASLEAAGVLLIIMVFTMYGAQKYNDYLEEKSWQLEAQRVTTWTAAARQYIGSHYGEIVKTPPSASHPYCVSTRTLTEAGVLTSGFAEKNPDGQTLNACLVALSNDTSRLEGMVVSEGGAALSTKGMILTSRDIRQGFGGYIVRAGEATGAQKAWTVSLAHYGIRESAAGHLAVMLSADDLTTAESSSREDADRLYRYKTDGRPELNAMQTDIDMSGNDLNNAGHVNTVNLNAETGDFSGNVTSGGTLSGQSGLFQGRVSTDEYLQLGGIATAGQSCYPNGLVGRDTRGALLSCQSGTWQSSGFGGIQDIISGECTPPYHNTKTCYLTDLSWFCMLSGVGGAGELEFGYVERRADGWYAVTQRKDWPAKYQWSCFR